MAENRAQTMIEVNKKLDELKMNQIKQAETYDALRNDLNDRFTELRNMIAELRPRDFDSQKQSMVQIPAPSAIFTTYPRPPQHPDPPDFNQFGQRLSKFEFPKFDGKFGDGDTLSMHRASSSPSYKNPYATPLLPPTETIEAPLSKPNFTPKPNEKIPEEQVFQSDSVEDKLDLASIHNLGTILEINSIQEHKSFGLTDIILEADLLSKFQVPISSLELSRRCQKESLDVDDLSYAIVRTIRSHSQFGLKYFTGNAPQVFDIMPLGTKPFKNRMKKTFLKTWWFKFKTSSKRDKLLDDKFFFVDESSEKEITELEAHHTKVEAQQGFKIHVFSDFALEALIGLKIYVCEDKKHMVLLIKHSNSVWERGGLLATHTYWKWLENCYERYRALMCYFQLEMSSVRYVEFQAYRKELLVAGLRQLILIGAKFHLKHKWKYKLMQPFSGMRLYMDNKCALVRLKMVLSLKFFWLILLISKMFRGSYVPQNKNQSDQKLSSAWKLKLMSIHYEAEFWRQYNDLEQFSSEHQSSLGNKRVMDIEDGGMIFLFEDLVCAVEVAIALHLGIIILVFIRTLSPSAGCFNGQQACSKAIAVTIGYGTDSETLGDTNRNATHSSLCQSLVIALEATTTEAKYHMQCWNFIFSGNNMKLRLELSGKSILHISFLRLSVELFILEDKDILKKRVLLQGFLIQFS